MRGPHMIFVPASTLENWTREFDKFAPSIDVQTYYGSQAERAGLRDTLKRSFRSGKLQVVLASYTQVAAKDDLDFFRKKIQFETCIYDEGHKLKSCTTKAYSDLLSIKPRWRLLLTGTPLQNNLQELVVSHQSPTLAHLSSLFSCLSTKTHSKMPSNISGPSSSPKATPTSSLNSESLALEKC